VYRDKTAELRQALRGRIAERHRTMLRLHLQLIDVLQRTLAELDAAVGEALAPIRQRARLLTTMPGVSDLTASVVVAEIGVDMTRFPSAGHLVSRAGLCPRSDERAGKRRSTRVRKSGTWVKTTLVTAAWSAVRVKTSDLRARFLRIKARRGAEKAILAVAAPMLAAAFHMWRDGTEYHDLGSEHFDRHDRSKTIRRLLERLRDLGCDVPETAHAA
jgi:transposase